MLILVTSVAGFVLLVAILELLRRRQLREKYAIVWLTVGILVIPAALFPRFLDSVARVFGIVNGVSLALFIGLVFVILVSIHLSWEANRLEEETRTLAEEVALLRLEISSRPIREEADGGAS